MSRTPPTCKDCPAPAQSRKRNGGPWPIYCRTCAAKRIQDAKNRYHKAPRLTPDPPIALAEPNDWFVLLLRSGWADSTHVPADVRRDAEAGKMPRPRVEMSERRSA